MNARTLACGLLAASAAAAEPRRDGGWDDAGAAGVSDGPEWARPFDVRQRVEPSQVKVGEPFTRTIVIEHDPSQRFDLRAPAGGGDVELLGHHRQRADAEGRATTTFVLRLSAFALGEVPLPPVAFDVAAPDRPLAYETAPSSVRVVSTLPEEGAELRDIRPPEPVPVPSYALLWALLAVAAAAVGAYLLYRYWRRPKAEPTAPTGHPLSAEERAMEALDALAREDLPGQGRVKQFYIRASEIVRAYAGERYGVEALECTTSELMDALEGVRAPLPHREGLRGFLEDADLVKFARAERNPTECHSALQSAYDLVHAPRRHAP